MLASDQSTASFMNPPICATLERLAGQWLLDVLDLLRDGAVGFGTSVTACGIACLAAARRAVLARAGWDFDPDGLAGAPEVRVVVSHAAHVTMVKALRILGFGVERLVVAPTDEYRRIDPARLPALDGRRSCACRPAR